MIRMVFHCSGRIYPQGSGEEIHTECGVFHSTIALWKTRGSQSQPDGVAPPAPRCVTVIHGPTKLVAFGVARAARPAGAAWGTTRRHMVAAAEQAWDDIQPELRAAVGTTFHDVWISVLGRFAPSEHQLYLIAPNVLYRDWVRDNYADEIDRLMRAHDPLVKVRVVLAEQVPAWAADMAARQAATEAAAPRGAAPQDDLPTGAGSADEDDPPSDATGATAPVMVTGHAGHFGLAHDKTFDNFVVGDCNQFAHAAASAVADDPGERQYNPLFIYGGTGLGKTHLMHAVGNRIVGRHPNSRVMYVTAEQFTNEMIDALRHKQMPEFRARYRQDANLLLVDDVQFLTGKDRTQEELFHTFEWLRERGRQIVFTADVLPREIKGFEPRLRTRCESGMIADMQPPDLETLAAIIESKSAERSLRVPKDLSQYLATRVRGSIRELEGVLNNLAQLCRLHGRPPSLDFARQHLARMLPDGPPEIDARSIIEAVASTYSVEIKDLMGSSRVKGLVTPRHVAMWLIRKHTQLSSPEIGRMFGKDHSTVLHACGKIDGQIDNDGGLRSVVQVIERNLLR